MELSLILTFGPGVEIGKLRYLGLFPRKPRFGQVRREMREEQLQRLIPLRRVRSARGCKAHHIFFNSFLFLLFLFYYNFLRWPVLKASGRRKCRCGEGKGRLPMSNDIRPRS
jgi:hypothetical protein